MKSLYPECNSIIVLVKQDRTGL